MRAQRTSAIAARCRTILVLVVTLAPLLVAVPSAGAKKGILDLSFGGGDGVVTTSLPSATGNPEIGSPLLATPDRARAVAIDAIGRIVVAGTTQNTFVGSEREKAVAGWVLMRYLPDGEPDDEFNGGQPVLAFNAGAANALVIQPDEAQPGDGKIVAAGTDADDNSNFATARFDADGTLDETFNPCPAPAPLDIACNGRAVAEIPGSNDVARAVALQPGGKIVVAGSANGHFALVRYTADGRPDATFGAAGVVVTPSSGETAAHALVVLPASSGTEAGKILVAGMSSEDGNSDMAVARYNLDGSLDTDAQSGFGPLASTPGSRTGVAKIDFGKQEAANALVAVGGHLVAAGYTAAETGCDEYQTPLSLYAGCHFALARLDATGTMLVEGFGNAGKIVTEELSDKGLKSLVLDGDGLVGVGGDTGDITLARYRVGDGALDPGFGTGGIARHRVGGFDTASAVALQPGESGNRLVVAGHTSAGDNSVCRDTANNTNADCDLLVARYTDGADSPVNLEVVLSADLSRVMEGRSVTYTATATNIGSAGTSVKLIDEVPGNAIVTDARSGAEACPTTVERVTCDLGIVLPGGTVTATITLVATRPGSLDNAVRAVGPSFDVSVPAAPVAVRKGAGDWKETKDPLVVGRRSEHTATLLDGAECRVGSSPDWCGKVLVVGGYAIANGDHPPPAENPLASDGPPVPLASVVLFDPAEGRWTSSDSCPTPSSACPGPLGHGRGSHTATLLTGERCGAHCGKVLVVGSGNIFDPGNSTAELYDPKTGKWELTAPLPDQRRVDATATLLTGPNCADKCGMVLVAGGDVFKGSAQGVAEPSPSLLYDPATGTWIPTGTLNHLRSRHTAVLLDGPGCADKCGMVLVVGGQKGCGQDAGGCTDRVQFQKSSELYDVAKGTWHFTGEPAVARAQRTATVLRTACNAPLPLPRCGQVLVAGGALEPGTGVTNDAQRYETGGGSWLDTQPLPMSRARHTASSLADGRVLVAGGACCAQPLHSAVPTATLFDPHTGTWAPAASLTKERRAHTATVLRDGRVLVVGGWTGPYGGGLTQALASAEIYFPPPLVTGIAPARGPAGGGTAVTVTGRGLTDVSEVRFGGVPARPDSVSDTAVVVRSPPAHRVGTVDVVVDGPLGMSVPNPAARFTYAGVPGAPRLAAVPVSETEVELAFGAVGADGAIPPPVGSYVIRQSSAPITEANVGGAEELCTCSFEPAAVDELLTQRITGLDRGTEYHYAVQAVGEDGTLGPLSNSVAVVTLGQAARAVGVDGYRLVGADGGVFAFGGARFLGSTGAIRLNQPITGMASTPSGNGYWLVARDGGVFAFGDARFFGSTGAIRLNQPVVGMAPTPSGNGYWLVAGDGGVFAFGDARFWGSTGAIRLNKPVVGMAATPSGRGYRLVGADGGLFAFGDARFFGSTGAIRLNQPMVGTAGTPSGNGYWLVARDGGVFAFGDARFFGSTGAIRLNQPVVGMSSGGGGLGYRLVGADGGVFAFGAAPFLGSAGALRLNQPIVGMASTGR